MVANRNAFGISGVFLAACNGFDATSNHPHYLFLFPQLSNLYTHIFINSSIIPGVRETTCRFMQLWSLIYQHEEGRRVSDSANRVAEKVGEEGDLAARAHLTPPFYIFDTRTVLDWVELSDHYTTDPVIHHHIVCDRSVKSLKRLDYPISKNKKRTWKQVRK